MKISSVLKNVGIIIGGLAAIYIIFQTADLLLRNKPAIIILGIGALTYFIGTWFKKKGK